MKHTVKNIYTANEKGLIIYKSKHKQRGRKNDYNVYKDNHPGLPKDVIGMFDLGFFGVEKDYRIKIIHTYQKGERLRSNCTAKIVQQKTFQEKDSDRTCHLQGKKVKDNK